MVIIGIREDSKLKTRLLIIDETRNALFEKGYLRLSTKDISNRSKVSQGTIFLHFESKNNLINYILIQLISDFMSDLKTTCNVNSKRADFVYEVLGVISIHENALSIVYRDYPHLSDEIRKIVDLSETTLKGLFFDNIRNSKGKEISIVDSFILIDAFLSQVKNYLLLKELNSHGNTIRQLSGKLNKLHRYLFQ